MKYIDNGTFYTVEVSEDDIQDFKFNWPCSGLPDTAVYFQFAKSNGDLVDTNCPDGDGVSALALSQDAQLFGEQFKNRVGL